MKLNSPAHEEAHLDEFGDEGALPGIGVDSSNAVHDRHQFESKFDFTIETDADPDTRRAYEIDVYFFVPASMGITSESFPRDRFYASLTHYLRMHAPQTNIPHLEDAASWTIESADRYLASHLQTLRRQLLAPLVVQDVRLFGCFVFTHFKRIQVRLARILERPPDELRARLADRIVAELWELDRIIGAFRIRYVDRVRYETLLLDEDVKRAFLLVDEYVSYRRESALIRIRHLLETSGTVASPENGRSRGLERLTAALHDEVEYRRRHLAQPQSLQYERDDDRAAAERENHYYRLGLLKKYVSGVLYVTSKPIRKDKVYKNAIGAIGAALAALWATLTQVQTTQMLADRNEINMRLMLFIALAVIAYVFKDRIKELTKEYFNERMKHKIPDFETTLYYPFVDAFARQQSENIGTTSEFLRYLGRGGIPVDVAYVRDYGHQAELEPERLETILHYSKRMEPHAETFRTRIPDVRRLHDVMRFDISEFLTKLSDPRKRLSYYDPAQGVKTVEAPKVYHLNVVFRYSTIVTRRNRVIDRSIEFERIRLVLNKKGIVRIESVLQRGDMGYAEAGP